MMSKVLKAHLTLVLVNVIYAANYLVAKGIMPDYIGPSGFIFYRVTGAVILFFILKTRISEKIDKKDWIKLALAGLFGVAINQLLFFNGLNLTSPINASIIMTSNPIMVLIISSVLLGDKITTSKLIGIIIGGAGAVLLLISTKGQSSGHASFEGDLMIFINAMSYAIYLVIAKPLLKKYNPITVITWVFFFGWIFVTPFGIFQATQVNWATMPVNIIWGVIYVVIFTTFLVYLLNVYALKIVSPAVASTYIYLQPVMAGLLAYLYDYFSNNTGGYSDDITLFKLFTTLMIFFGVYLAGRPSVDKATVATHEER
jgi:drug/metabolite transporter (DMT)-like permease